MNRSLSNRLRGVSFLSAASFLVLAGCGDDGTGSGGAGGEAPATTSQGVTVSSTSVATSSASATRSSSTGGAATSCTPLAGAAVGPECGAFVSPQGGTSGGTADQPFASIALATAASAKRIYVCKGTYLESVNLAAGVEIYGGVDCANGWAWRATPLTSDRSRVVAPVGERALTVQGANGAKAVVFGMTLEASDAVDDGASSVAAAVDGGEARFAHVDLVAGAGAPGANGEPPVGAAADGLAGLGGFANASQSTGGASVGNPACMLWNSGAGGPGGIPGSGNPYPASSGQAGQGALGGTAGAAQTSASACTKGGDGDDGGMGAEGEGGTSPGVFEALAWRGTDGGTGGVGEPGGPGGGGGGSRTAPNFEAPPSPGRPGGSGGAGGCGGVGGFGGRAGGSSFGLIVRGATMTFVDVTVDVDDAGRGGDGATGQLGGGGGAAGPNQPGGLTGTPSCYGGVGGDGGRGGSGGGGAGGNAVGVVFVGSDTPVVDGFVVHLPPAAAEGGNGANVGHPGVLVESLSFEEVE